MSSGHIEEHSLLRVTKSEACRRLGVSLSTLDRRIAAGELPVEREQLGAQVRVMVLLPADTPDAAPGRGHGRR